MIAAAYPIAWVAVLVISIATKGGATLFILLIAFATVHAFRLRRRVFAIPSRPTEDPRSADIPR